MVGSFIYKEIVESVSGPKFLITLAICSTLILISAFTGYMLYESEMDWYANSKAENEKALTNLGSYGNLESNGAKVIREPSRLGIFVKGVDSIIGKAARVSDSPEIVLRDSRFGLNPVFATFGELDLALIVKMILSLFALLFSYNAISGEREMGMLKQVFSNPVGRASFIVGKSIGGLATLMIPFLLPFLAALLLLMTVFNVSFTGEEWVRIGLMTLAFLLYLAVFYMIGMLMSALTRSSFVSFLLCLFVWVLSVAIIPKAAVELAGQISPAPSIDAIQAQRSALRREMYAHYKELITKRVNDLIATGRISDDDAWSEARSTSWEEAETPVIEAEEAMLREYSRRQLLLLNTSMTLARVSPTACTTFAANRLAMTDADLREYFLESLRRYKSEYLSYAEMMIKANPEKAHSGTGHSLSIDEDADGQNRTVEFTVRVPEFTLDLSTMPEFSLESESLEEASIAILPDLAILVLEFLAAFAFAFMVFIRYDVR